MLLRLQPPPHLPLKPLRLLRTQKITCQNKIGVVRLNQPFWNTEGYFFVILINLDDESVVERNH